MLVKTLEESETKKCPEAIDGVLFARRTSTHFSTGFILFYMLHMREAVLPVEVSQLCAQRAETEADKVDAETFKKKVNALNNIRKEVLNKASENIKKAQKRYEDNYENRH